MLFALFNVAVAVAAPILVSVVDVESVVHVGIRLALRVRTWPFVPVVNPLTAVPVVA